MIETYDKLQQKRKEERAKLQLHLNQERAKYNTYVKKHLAIKESMDETELDIYKEERTRLEKIIDGLDQDIKELGDKERNDIFEFETMLTIFKNIGKKVRKLNYVQKRKIAHIFCLNIEVMDDFRLKLYINPALEELFSHLGQCMEYFSNSLNILNTELIGKQDMINCFFAILNHNNHYLKNF